MLLWKKELVHNIYLLFGYLLFIELGMCLRFHKLRGIPSVKRLAPTVKNFASNAASDRDPSKLIEECLKIRESVQKFNDVGPNTSLCIFYFKTPLNSEN